MENLSIDAITRDLDTRYLGRRIIYHEQVGSTNDIAKQLADAGEPEGTMVITDFQSAGRGRMARSWVAPAESSILISLLLKPALRPDQIARVTMAVSLGTSDAIRMETRLDPQIKWPNDILVNGKKCAGILAEAGIAGQRVEYVIVGLGVNVNFSAASVAGIPANATTIAAELGYAFPREELVIALLRHIERYYLRLKSGEDLCGEWKSRLAMLGKCVRVDAGDRVAEGIVQDVDEDGALVLERDDGSSERFVAGDVTLREQL